MKPKPRLALGLLLLGVLLLPSNIFSSGGWVEATFVLQHQPDDPLKNFDEGKLGILRPKFDRRYLVIAYRYLEQKPLRAEERQSLDDAAGPHITPPGTPYDPDPPVTAWLKTRSHVLGLQEVQKIDIQRYRRNVFAEYPNCGDDAFTNAVCHGDEPSPDVWYSLAIYARMGCRPGRRLPELRQRCRPSVLPTEPDAAARDPAFAASRNLGQCAAEA